MFPENQISALIACDHYVEVLVGEERILVDETLETIEKRLARSGFARIHRGSIVNISFVRELRRDGDRKYIAILSDHFHTELAVSRENLARMKQILKIKS